jgi:RNA polymerase sigma-70 factor (ECF subfamily)
MRRYLDDKTSINSKNDIEFLFESLFKKHEAPMYRIAVRVTKSQLHAADIVQEVFLKIWEHKEELKNIRNEDAWVTRILKNKLIDFMRKASADDRLKNSLWREISVAQNETEQMLEAKESDTLIKEAVNELPPQRKLVYQLNRESGLSYEQIADKLSISKHTVKNQLSTALRFIQKKFSFE